MADDRHFASRVARAFAFSGVGNILAKGMFLVSLLIVLKLMGTDDFGVASIVLAVFAITEAFNELGLGVALIQRKETSRDEIDALFWVSLGISTLLYLIILAGAPLLASFYEQPRLTSLFRVYGLILIMFPFYFIPRNLLMKDLAFGKLAIADNLSLAAASTTMILMGYYDFGPWAIIGGDLVHRLGRLVFYNSFHPFFPRFSASFARIKGMIRFGAYVTGSRLLYNFYIHADYLIVGKVFGAEVLGIYTLAYRVVSDPVKTLAMIANQVAYPAFSALQDDVVRLRRYFFTITRFNLMLIGTVLAVVAVYVDWLLNVGGYDHYTGVAPLVRVLTLVGLIRCVAPLIPQLLNAADRAKLNFFYSLATACIMPVAFLIGSQISLMGVAMSWIIAYPMVVLVLFKFGSDVLDMRLPHFAVKAFSGIIGLLPIALVILLIRSLLELLYARAPLLTAVTGVVVSLVFGVGVTFLIERKTVKTVLKQRKSKKEPK